MGVFMSRRDVILLNNNLGTTFGNAVLEAHNSGTPLQVVFEQFGVEFNQLFSTPKVEVRHDVTRDGIEEVVIYNKYNSLMYIRPNGVVKITFYNKDAIQKYENNGIFSVVTRQGSKRQNRRLELNATTLQPHFICGGECR